MSKIPFNFIPIPAYFYKSGLFQDHACLIYVNWAFSRCSATSRTVFFLKNKVELDAFEYISGLATCSFETGLTYRQIRTQQEKLIQFLLLEKTTSKTTNKYSVYKWNIEAFCEIGDKQNDKPATSKRQASDNKQEEQEGQDILDKQQPPTPKGGFVVVECLKLLNISDASRRSLQKSFTEEELELAVRWCKEYERQGNVIDNLGGMIRTAARDKLEMPKPKKDLKKSLDIFKHGEKYNNAECWRDKESIGFTRGQKYGKVLFSSRTFFQDVRNMLDSFGIELEFEWEKKIISIG